MTANNILILLAEDNSVMQSLTLKQIARLGFCAKAVRNGEEVLVAIKNDSYSLILMDCQMPILDGFKTAKAIREIEKDTGIRVPIVALTASASDEDRLSCLKAGMDDYLAKPVNQKQLHEILNRWCTNRNEILPKECTSDILNESILDMEQLESLYGKDSLQNILQSFLQEAESLLTAINIAASQRDLIELKTQTHQLKGLAAVMNVKKLEAICVSIEQDAKNYDWEAINKARQDTDEIFESIEKFISTILAKNNE
jgi:CheY-like chemotaxis protein/HPt (histidine-containing phosphotransfer) domain-containing protein